MKCSWAVSPDFTTGVVGVLGTCGELPAKGLDRLMRVCVKLRYANNQRAEVDKKQIYWAILI